MLASNCKDSATLSAMVYSISAMSMSVVLMAETRFVTKLVSERSLCNACLIAVDKSDPSGGWASVWSTLVVNFFTKVDAGSPCQACERWSKRMPKVPGLGTAG